MAHDALRTILPITGWPEERARAVEITGGADPVLPTPFRIGAVVREIGVDVAPAAVFGRVHTHYRVAVSPDLGAVHLQIMPAA